MVNLTYSMRKISLLVVFLIIHVLSVNLRLAPWQIFENTRTPRKFKSHIIKCIYCKTRTLAIFFLNKFCSHALRCFNHTFFIKGTILFGHVACSVLQNEDHFITSVISDFFRQKSLEFVSILTFLYLLA